MEEKDFIIGTFMINGSFKYKIYNEKYNLSMDSINTYSSVSRANIHGQAELKNIFNKTSKQKFLKACNDTKISSTLKDSFAFRSIYKEISSLESKLTIKEVVTEKLITETTRNILSIWLFKEDIFLNTKISELLV